MCGDIQVSHSNKWIPRKSVNIGSVAFTTLLCLSFWRCQLNISQWPELGIELPVWILIIKYVYMHFKV